MHTLCLDLERRVGEEKENSRQLSLKLISEGEEKRALTTALLKSKEEIAALQEYIQGQFGGDDGADAGDAYDEDYN